MEPPHAHLPMMLNDCTVALDKNILMRADWAAKHPEDSRDHRVWLSQLNRPGIRLNPIFVAWEGRHRAFPSRSDFIESCAHWQSECFRLFPHAAPFGMGEAMLAELYESRHIIFQGHEEREVFLQRWMPVVAQPFNEKTRWGIVDDMLSDCLAMGISAKSPFIALCLATVFDRGGASPKRPIASKILKPKKIYTKEDAHNSLFDLGMIEFLIQSTSFPGPPLAICTSDVPLARAWQALAVTADHSDSRARTYKAQVTPALFPLLTLESCGQIARRVELAASSSN